MIAQSRNMPPHEPAARRDHRRGVRRADRGLRARPARLERAGARARRGAAHHRRGHLHLRERVAGAGGGRRLSGCHQGRAVRAHPRGARRPEPHHLDPPMAGQPGVLDRAADRDQRARRIRADVRRGDRHQFAGGRGEQRGRGDARRRPATEGRSGDRRRRRQFEGARQPRPDGKAQAPGRRLHAAPDSENHRGGRAGGRDHGRILVRQPPCALHAVQPDRGLYRADHARLRRHREGRAGRQGGVEALVSAS